MAMRRPDVDAMLSEISSTQLTRWMAFYRLEPWGAQIEDRRAAMVAWIIASVNSSKGHRPRFEDFMPRYWRPEPVRQKESSIKAALNTLVKGKTNDSQKR